MSRKREAGDRIVAVGLLTQADVDSLGGRLSRLYPVTDDDSFDDLLRALDQIPHHVKDTPAVRDR
ncbi:hypothetical protein [Sphingomonas sp. TZW2008]|uniref:hypothetical protein n=1 Tax=Sphingomonas sp. TZW2008 TaxID=1917973 RepID=UPI000A267085|nr:hypothetical protein [Sphingomonas sp. TZW2008]